MTDLVFHVPASEAHRARLFYTLVGAVGRFGPHRLVRLAFRDTQAARRSVAAILEWDFDRVVMSHGQVLETGGHDPFRAAFAWLQEIARDP